MMSKDPNFISNKLNELKRTALQQNAEGQRMANPGITTQYISRPLSTTDGHNLNGVTYSVSRPVLGGSFTEDDMAPTRIRKEYQAQPATITLEEYKRKLDRESSIGSGKKETYRVNEQVRRTEYSPPKVSYKSYTTTPMQNGYKPTIDEPRVIKSRNVLTPNVHTVYEGMSNNYAAPTVSYMGTSTRPLQSYSVEKFRQTAPVIQDDVSLLKNIGRTALNERYKVNMAEDLNSRLQDCSDVNRKLVSEVEQLRRALEAERAKTEDIDKMCRDDFNEVKKREQEARKEWESMEGKHQERIQMIKRHEEKSYNVS